MKYISRLDYVNKNGGATRGWWVRIKMYSEKYQCSKFFSDGKNWGKTNALKTARAWRDKTWLALPKKAKIIIYSKPNLGKCWGKGVYFQWKPSGTSNWSYACYVATWWVDGTLYTKQFSCNVLGYPEAERRAKALRKKMTANKVRR